MMSMPLSARFVFVGQPHLALAAAEQRLEHLLEVLVDRFEGFLEAAARFGVEFLNRFLGIADRIEQVLPLRVQEIVALLRFLELFERLRIHRTQRLDPRADFLIALLGFGHARLQSSGFLGLRSRAASSAAANRMFSSLRLVSSRYFSSACLLHQFQFDLVRAAPARSVLRCASACSASSSAASAARPPVSCAVKRSTAADCRRRMRPPTAAARWSSSMLSASSRARSTPMRSSSRASSSRRADNLPDLRFEARCRGLLGRGAFFKAGQLGPQRGMFFADRVRVRLQRFEFAARDLQRFFLIEPRLLLLRHQQLIAARAARGTRSIFAASRSSSSRATESREPARAYSSASLRCS